MNRFTGFQLGYPELLLPTGAVPLESRSQVLWDTTQRIVAGAALVLLSPLFLLMWALVTATSPGGFLFFQERPGRNGTTFRIFKVRTMRAGSERRTSLGVTLRDATVTPVGRILRALKFDELPQLWNVLGGEMALVGPRPIPTALDAELRAKIPGFHLRYSVPPGLTSIGQICVNDNAVGEALVADWRLRFEGELHYLRNRSARYDFVMIAMTALFVLRKTLRG